MLLLLSTPRPVSVFFGMLHQTPHWLQMEVSFDSMAEFEGFLSTIPFHDHKAWTQRIASMVVDGSPVWQVGPAPSACSCAV